MEFVRPGTYIDFMRVRTPAVAISGFLVLASIVSVFYPGPNYGIDFAGGTELQLAFQGNVDAAELRSNLEELGYHRPDVVSVEGRRNEYIVRVGEVSALPPEQVARIEEAAAGLGTVQDMDVSPGGDKVDFKFAEPVDPERIGEALEAVGVRVRSVNPFGRPDDHRYEAHLVGVGDEIVSQLDERLGERGPDAPLRVEWVGPKAGEQLRDAAIKALLYSIALIMVYVALRFDLRFAPGGVIALAHDVLITLGVYVLVQKEVNLTTIAALLTVLGYSINDTIVVYDRIRENMGRSRDKSLTELINISMSQMLSRTIITNGTVMLSISAFFFWGTPAVRDICFAIFIGVGVGTYSSIYIAAPVTEWIDRLFFRKAKR